HWLGRSMRSLPTRLLRERGNRNACFSAVGGAAISQCSPQSFAPHPSSATSPLIVVLAQSVSSITKRRRGDKPPLISTFALGANFNLRLALQPSIDVLAHHIFRETVAMLDYTFKLFALSVDLSQIVIGELAPLLFDLALSFFPIS